VRDEAVVVPGFLLFDTRNVCLGSVESWACAAVMCLQGDLRLHLLPFGQVTGLMASSEYDDRV